MLNVYLLKKIKVNKWIILALAILVFFLPIFFNNFNLNQYILVPVQSILFVILLLWFFDLVSMGKVKKEKQIKIKPKAKPNRVKNMSNNEELKNKKR
nr:hypothetical protein [Clostridium simiarum]